jgi:hypothetical protein
MSQLPNNSEFFPADLPTPNSYGQTYHKHNFETDGLSNHLNINNDASGNWTGEIGGFNFSTINSTLTEPISLATIDISGITIDNSTSGGSVVYSPNVITLFPDGQNIEVDGDLFSAPYNFQNQTFNPVYMTQTTALYTTGDLCYVVCGSDRVIQIFNNNAITNPIPPNVVPSDFGNSSNVGFTLGIPLFSLTPPSPSITKTTNLNETLTIIDDVDTSILSATDLTFNSVSLQTTLNNLTIKQTTVSNQGLSLAIFADGRPALAPTSTISQQYAFSPSWYFKNTFASNNKIL